MREISSGRTILASRGPGLPGVPLESTGSETLSADGHHVAFVVPDALETVDTNSLDDVYVRDLDTGAVALASRADTPAGPAGDAFAGHPSLSADGRRASFHSAAANYGTGDAAGNDVFVRDLTAGKTLLASRADGADGVPGNGLSAEGSLSGDGQRVAFISAATNLGSGGSDDDSDIFVRHLAVGRTLLASRADGPGGAAEDGVFAIGGVHSISSDGRRVAFVSLDAALVPGDANGAADAFVRDLEAGRTLAASRVDGADGALAPRGGTPGGMSADGRCVMFVANGPGVVANPVPGGDFQQVYLRALDGDCPASEPVPSPSPSPSPSPLPPPTPVPIADPPPVLSGFSISPKRILRA